MDLFDAPYYWGRITRQDAEDILEQAGFKNGLYLVREKYEEAGSYAITLFFLKRFYHYRIDRLKNGNVVLNGSRTQERFSRSNGDDEFNHSRLSIKNSKQREFAGPIELISYFQQNAEPLVTTLSVACQRPFNHNFVQFWCVPLMAPELYINKIFQEASNTDPEIPIKEKLTLKRYIYERRVLKTIHESELWFHARINRQEAELRLKTAGARNGLFLVREKPSDKRSSACFILSLCFQREYHHYIIQKTPDDYLQVASANKSARVNRFGSLAQLVDFYHRNHQDIAFLLEYPCTRPGGSVRIVSIETFLEVDKSTESETSGTDLWSSTSSDLVNSLSAGSHNSKSISPCGFDTHPKPSLKDSVFIEEKYLIIGDKLGAGQFGEVYSGKLIANDDKNSNVSIHGLQQVAIKRIRHKHDSCVKELFNEGERMLSLDHPYIVKIFGICKHETSVSLILELCPHGAMHRWLKSNKTFHMSHILNYLYQVSDGMNYLHEKNIIHRDLALRNILIMSETVCKISDFGLSRVLDKDTYYHIGQHRRLPSMWYPPEVLEVALFHPDIDIWSFGITVWEATSYGQTPYKEELEAMSSTSFEPLSRKLLRFLRAGNRLKQPANCPNAIYDLMLLCWHDDKHKRPTFTWIKQYLSSYAFSQI